MHVVNPLRNCSTLPSPPIRIECTTAAEHFFRPTPALTYIAKLSRRVGGSIETHLSLRFASANFGTVNNFSAPLTHAISLTPAFYPRVNGGIECNCLPVFTDGAQ